MIVLKLFVGAWLWQATVFYKVLSVASPHGGLCLPAADDLIRIVHRVSLLAANLCFRE